MKVAVVGSGIHGSNAAWQLAERGHEVVLFEQNKLGHELGSSHGQSRIVRRAYPDPFYVECMMHAYPMWAELQQASGREILHEVGLLYFGDEDSANLQGILEGLKRLEVVHSAMTPIEVRQVAPMLRLHQHEMAIWSHEAGWVNARTALHACWDLARRHGAEIRQETKAHREELEKDFDAFVVCAGAWIQEWVNLPVRVTLEAYGHVRARVEGPVWIADTPRNPYGFPTEGGLMKIGIHQAGYTIDPESNARVPSKEAIETIQEVATERFGVRNPVVEDATGCLYTSTANEDFLLGRIGEKGFFASACSGHGFKFGPWIGKLMADFVEGKTAPNDFPRFFWE